MEIPKLESLTREARVLFFKREGDDFSFADFMGLNLAELASAREGRVFDVPALKELVDYDVSAPDGGKTVCALCLAVLLLNEAERRYPDDEKMQSLIQLYDELEKDFRPFQVIEAQKQLERKMRLWTWEELQDIQNKFSEIKREILNKRPRSLEMIPRYHMGIYRRSNDDHLLGSEIERNGKKLFIGSFAAVKVDKRTCFNKLAFVLGLEPGYHILAGCGNPGDYSSHLYELRNFRLKFRKEAHRQRPDLKVIRWTLLPAQTYKEAQERKEYFENNEAKSEEKSALAVTDLWREAKEFKPGGAEEIWIEGKELEVILNSEPDRTFSHTVRAMCPRKNILTGEWEIYLVTEKGDKKTGGKATARTGKPPGIGCPGGMLEPNETLGRTLVREAENESEFGDVAKIVALVAEMKKARLPGENEDNIDHWFLVQVNSEHFLSRKIIENDEIYAARWVPLAELPSFTFQDRNNPVWNVKVVDEKKIMYFNHGAHLARIMPRVPGIELPSNFGEFQENIKKFIKDSR